MHEVESCINSRPLTFVADEVDSGRPHTPAHFLMERPFGVSAGELGEINLSDISAASIKDKHKICENICWNIFGICGNLST